MGYVGKVTDTDGTTGLIGSTLYGTCSTAADTVAKVGTCSDFDTLIDGVTIHIKFTNSNTATNPTLNVNGTGAKRIYKNGTTSVGTTVATSWAAGSVVSLTYDGSAWQMNDHTDNTNTTYSAGTGLSLSGQTFNHSNSVTAGTAKGDDSKTLTFGGTFTIPTVTYDAQGHITGKGTTTMTMPANPDTDAKVVQSSSTTSNYRPVMLGYTSTTNVADLAATVTNQVYATTSLFHQPSTGYLYATEFYTKSYLSGTGSALCGPGLYLRSYFKRADNTVVDYRSSVLRTYNGKITSNDGLLLAIGGGGLTIVGGGESATSLADLISNDQTIEDKTTLNVGGTLNTSLVGNTERLIMSSDDCMFFITNCQTIANRKPVVLDTNSYFYPGTTGTGSLGTSTYKWNSAYINTIYGTATSANILNRNNTVTATTTGLQYAVGEITIGAADGNAAEGSNASYKLWSYPTGGTATSSTSANIQNLRLYWSSTYFRDIFISPNNQDIYHRAVKNGSAKPWRVILDSFNLEQYNVHNDTVSKTFDLTSGNTMGPVERSIDLFNRANKLALIKSDKISIEYSTDSGSNWTAYGLTADQNADLFNGSTFRDIYIGPNSTAERTTSMQTRITITNDDRDVIVDQIFLMGSTSYHTVSVDIQVAYGNATSTFSNWKTGIEVGPWRYQTMINLVTKRFGAGTTASYVNKIRFILKYTKIDSNHKTAKSAVKGISGFGGCYWTGNVPNYLALNNHLYSWDNSKNATFPANIVATGFKGTVYHNATNPTSESNYPVSFGASSSDFTSRYSNIGVNDGISYRTAEGTTSANGFGILCLGNSIASGTAGNKYGGIRLYSSAGTYYTQITPTTLTATRQLSLPNKGGTIAVTSDIPTVSGVYLPLAGGTMTGDITFTSISGDSYPIASKGIKWGGGTDAIDMYYNLRASDAGELIINMRDDTNVRTSFAYNGTVKSYIDTNGVYNGNCSGTSSNVTGTVAIANGGTGATTRLDALKNLTNQSVGTDATYFLTITNSWGKGGYTTVAQAKTVLGLKSAAYTESSDYVPKTTVSSSTDADTLFSTTQWVNWNTTTAIETTHMPTTNYGLLLVKASPGPQVFFPDTGTGIYLRKKAADSDATAWMGITGNAGATYNLSNFYKSTTSRTANTVLAAPNGSDGAATFRKLVAADIPSLSYLPLTGGNVSGGIYYKSTKYDGSAANNGVSSGSEYPTTFNILDKSSRILVRLEGIINSTGAIGSYWYIRNYNTSGTMVAQKGISMSMAKDGTLTYAVSDGANFRSAIGAGTSSLTIGTTATTAAAGNHTHNYAGSSSAGGAATSANKINTDAGSATLPVYFSGGIPVVTTAPKSGAWFSSFTGAIGSSGVMEVGRYIDFHSTNAGTTDYDVRIDASSTSLLTITSNSGTPQLRLSGTLPRLRFTQTTSDKAYDNALCGISAYPGNTAGVNLTIQSGGNTFIGGGESPASLYTRIITTDSNPYGTSSLEASEQMFITSDNNIYFVSGAGSISDTAYTDWTNLKTALFDSNGYFRPSITDKGSIGTSSYPWHAGYINTLTSLGVADGRTSVFDGNGLKLNVTSSNNWAMGMRFYNNTGETSFGGFGAYGTANAFSYHYIGPAYNNPIVKIERSVGTTSAVGYDTVTIGNSTASGTANNQTGRLTLYGTGAYAGTIVPTALSAARTYTLPNASGTISLDGHTHNYAGSSSAGGPATNVAIARVTKDSKVFPGANKVVFEEYTNGTTYNLPSNHFYHIMSAQGNNTKHGTQLALGMTTTAAYYRSYNNQTWSAWKSIINSDTYDRNRYNASIKAGSSALVAANIIVGKDGVYKHLKSGGAFDITYPILYLAGAVDANGTTTNTYDIIHFTITTTQSITLAAYRPVYIKGILNGTVFTPVSATPLVQQIPTYDTYDYIYLGHATSSTNVYLQERHPIYSHRNGRVQEITPCASMAATTDGFIAPMIKKLYDDPTTSTNYITISDINIDDYEFFIICVTDAPKTDWESEATQWIPARIGVHHFMINNGAAPSQGGGYIHCTDGGVYIFKTGTNNKDLQFTLCRPTEAIKTSGSSVTTDNFPNTRIMRVYGVKAF